MERSPQTGSSGQAADLADLGRVLVVEDDPETAQEIVSCLAMSGYTAELAPTAGAALDRVLEGGLDAVTLDRMLPDGDGLSVVASLRRRGCEVPVLMVSALSDVDDRITGLRAGGDDYLVKPFAPGELVARIEVLIRRQRRGGPAETLLKAADLELDLIRHEARRQDQLIELLPTEFKLLEFLMRNPGRILSRRLIFESVWGMYFDPGTNLINVHVGKLRRKIDRPGLRPLFVTERGTGYMLDAG